MSSFYNTSMEGADEGLSFGGQPTLQSLPSCQTLSSAQTSVLNNNNNPPYQYTQPVIENPIFTHPDNMASLQIEGSDTILPLSGLHQSMHATFWPAAELQPPLFQDHTSRLTDISDQNLTYNQDFGSDMDLQMLLANRVMPTLELSQPLRALSGPSAHHFGQSNTATSLSHLDQSTIDPLEFSQDALSLGARPYSFTTYHQPEAENNAQQSSAVAQPATRKRAPKALTMSAAKWKPAESRIRQLFLDEERNYKEVMAIVNQEFGFTATERQYKAKVLQMKLKRNVEASKRSAIVRHILHRKQSSGKVTKFIRVQGHRKSEVIVQKWMKEYPMRNSPDNRIPLSPLPSQISLRTGSPVASPSLSKSSWLHAAIESPIERLLRYAQGPNTVLKSEQCGAILNDFQHVLSSGSDIFQCPYHNRWSSVLEQDLVRIRNGMNMTNELQLDSRQNYLHQIEPHSNRSFINRPFKINRGFGSRRTPHGRVTAVFWQQDSSLRDDDAGESQATRGSIAAQIAIYPNGKTSSPVRIVLDFDTRLNPSARITYQAMIPNNSEIFIIIERGKLEDLVRVLEGKMASLSDRDENGRSLLNYAKNFDRVDILKFLLETGSDPDAIELSWFGDLRPLTLIRETLTCDCYENFELNARSECFKLLFQANADVDMKDGNDQSVFETILKDETSTTLKHVIRLGGPLVNPHMLTSDDGFISAQCSPLMTLVSEAGYRYDSTLHILEKAIILLKWGVDISCRDLNGNTVLHRTLSCDRAYTNNHGLRPFSEPGELLKIFIAAGADVYTLNNAGRSASRTARNFGREKEWSEALLFCGFDAEEVIAQTMQKYKPYMGPRHTSKPSFDEYCRTWSEEKWAEKMSWENAADTEKNDDRANESELKSYYWEKGERWTRRWLKTRTKRIAKAKSKAEAGSSDAVGPDCCCSENGFSNVPEIIMENEEEIENEDSTDASTEYSSDFPLETWGYSSGDDSDEDPYYGSHWEGHPSAAINGTEHSIAAEYAEGENSASTDLENENIDNDTNWQPTDPLLYADEGQSTASSWRYAATEGRRNEDAASINSLNFFQGMEDRFNGAFETELDAFMAIS